LLVPDPQPLYLIIEKERDMRKELILLCSMILLAATASSDKETENATSVFSGNLSEPEAPVILPDGSLIVAEMGQDKQSITHISADGKTQRIIAKTGRPNGLAIDKNSIIWVAESENPPSLIKLTKDGKKEIFLEDYNGTPFLFPNDLAFGPDGALYMTDSGIKFSDLVQNGSIRSDYMDIKTDGRVFRIDLQTRDIEEIDSGLKFANGIAFGPDNDLYVNEMFTGNIYRYRWIDGKIAPKREFFGNVFDKERPKAFNGPDGMKFSANGQLFVAVYGAGMITVLGSDGSIIKHIPTQGSMPTNIAFAADGQKKIYVTEDETGTLQTIDVDASGLPLYK
jgi:gluconolactonase